MKYPFLLAFVCVFTTAKAQEKEKLPVCDPSILVTDSFCPNCDGTTGVFLPQFTGQKPSDYQLSVYNRWGQQIFETKDHEQGWNGKLDKNDLAPAGTYFWTLKYTLNSKNETCSGNFTLLR